MFDTQIPLYGIFILIGIICGIYNIHINAKKINITKEKNLGLVLYIVTGSIIGAKYFSYITNPQKYGTFNFENLGLSSYGAVIGILIMIFIFSKQFKIKYKELINIVLKAIPLMYAIGKIGCFVAGCCYGIEYDGIFSITYQYSLSAPNGISLFPVQIVETIAFLLIFIYLNTTKNKDNIIAESFILCGISKFSLDYLRMSHVGEILSLNQIISLIFIVIGIFLILKNKKCNFMSIKC